MMQGDVRERSAMTQAGAQADAESAAEAAGALDLLLSDAALGPLRRFRPDASVLRFAARLARKPQLTGGTAALVGMELGKILAGRSAVAPDRRDRRFTEPAWTANPVLKRIMQAYLVAGQGAEGLLAGAELDWRDGERVTFLLSNLIAAASPSTNPVLNPAGWKAVIDTGGSSAVRGVAAMVSDLSASPRVPSMVEPGAFEVGVDLAATAGAVVHRTEVFELIQYQPVTPAVHRYPLVIVPPMINKFYITDLAPGRSMVEYLVGQGHQVFVVSWRNPDARHAGWNLNTYGGAIVTALDTACEITRSAKASICALCSGGIVSSMVAAHLNESGRADRLASLCLGVTVLDQARAGTPAALVDETTATAAKAVSRAQGYLDGRALAEVFAWLRPSDLVWTQAAAVRHPVLERRHHPAACRPARRLHRPRPGQRPDPSRPGHDARLRGGPVQGGRERLHGGGRVRPPVPLAVLLPRRPAARRRGPLRAVHQRAHRLDGEPPRQPQGHLPDRAGRGGRAG
jgi:polyhydroxyalkanoate synthase